MSEDTTTQTVVDTPPAPATPGATADGARTEDLDTLLAQFELQTTKTDPPSPPAQQVTQTDQGNIAAELQALKSTVNQFAEQNFRADLNALVKDVKGDLDYDDDVVEAWIDAQARRDNRLQRAFLERKAKPEVFQRVAKELGREFSKRVSKRPDPALTEDREAVAAAVRGASTHRAPESPPPSFGKQSNAEFRKHVMDTYGYDPGV